MADEGEALDILGEPDTVLERAPFERLHLDLDADLLEHDGLYAQMWSRQREANEAEEKLKKVREEDDLGIIERRAPAAE